MCINLIPQDGFNAIEECKTRRRRAKGPTVEQLPPQLDVEDEKSQGM